MISKFKSGSVLGTLCLALCAGNAGAALVNFQITGDVATAASGNVYGLNVGDTIIASGVYDDSALTGGAFETVNFANAVNNMTISAGSVTYNDADDILGGADLNLSYGAFFGLDFTSAVDNFTSINTTFASTDQIGGTWDAASFAVTPAAVPVPAAVWLFSSGLLGVVGVARRRR